MAKDNVLDVIVRCGRDDIWPPPPLPYNPDETCNENILNILANINATNSGDPVWKKMPTNNFTLTKKDLLTVALILLICLLLFQTVQYH